MFHLFRLEKNSKMSSIDISKAFRNSDPLRTLNKSKSYSISIVVFNGCRELHVIKILTARWLHSAGSRYSQVKPKKKQQGNLTNVSNLKIY